jgi:rhodanese-related sulfurtransferase
MDRMFRAGLRITSVLILVAVAGPGRADTPAAAPTNAGERLAAFFAHNLGSSHVISAASLWESISAGAAKYLVVDVRKAEDYAKGHVPGAVSLPLTGLFRPESLAKLPAPTGGKSIVLVCYTGHMESMALGGLVALGYEPYVLRFGMLGWEAQSEVRAGPADQPPDIVHGVGAPVEK